MADNYIVSNTPIDAEVYDVTIIKGDKGDTGDTGSTPDISIGTVTTLPAGSNATVSVSGTPEQPVMSFGIPKGDKGDTGDTGATGKSAYQDAVDNGYTGTQAQFGTYLANVASDLAEIENITATAATLPAGSNATASYSAGLISLGIPKGDKGDTGNTGATGATPQISVTATTLSAGSSATASVSGTAASPLITFGIPKGADGDVSSASMATTYSTSATYAVGDFVWYSGQLYRCTTAITTAEAWTAAHWTSAKLAEDVGELKSAVDMYCVGKNLVGSDPGILYPCYIPAGTYIVMSTSDGNNNTVSGLQLLLYNSSKQKVEYFTFATTYSYRKVRYTDGDVYYLAWNKQPAVPMQVEIGETKTAYEEYFYTAKGVTPLIRDVSIVNIPPLQRSAFSLSSVLTNAGKKQGYPYANLTDSSDWTTSEFVPVKPGDVIVYRLYGQNNTAAAISFFNGEKTTISAASIKSKAFWYTGVAVAPPDASYVRFCNKSGYGGSVVFWKDVPDSVRELTDKVPYYWNAALETALSTIESNRDAESADTVEFLFVTDAHWKYNAKNSPYLINRLSDMTECKMVVFGGDQISGYNSTKDGALAELRELYPPFSKGLDLASSIGNHDLNSNSNSDTSLYLTLAQAYNIMQKRTEKFSKNNIPEACSYWDNENQKVRFIQIYRPYDVALSSGIKSWVTSVVSELGAGWGCVFFSHAFWSSAEYGTPLTTSVQGKADADFLSDLCATYGVTPIAWIVGHTHRDYSEVITSASSNKLLVICTTTDCYTYGNTDSGYSMTPGTDTEQALDFFQIDTANKTVKATRIGAGNDRNWTYT